MPLVLEGSITAASTRCRTLPRRELATHRVIDEMHYFVGTDSCVNRYLVTPPQFMRVIDSRTDNGTTTTTTQIDTPGRSR